MKVLIDSNVLFSAAYAKGSIPFQAFAKAVEPPYLCLVCEQSFEEIRRAFNRKFPERIDVLERFIASILPIVEVVSVPPSKYPDEDEVRDLDDRPILRAAIKAGADYLLTGDKDFLESGLTAPKIVTAVDFLRLP